MVKNAIIILLAVIFLETTLPVSAIAGANGFFYWADARFDGNAIVLSAEQVSDPVHVRYAWSNFAGDTNMRNKEGFPAFPFRTDHPNYLKNKK